MHCVDTDPNFVSPDSRYENTFLLKKFSMCWTRTTQTEGHAEGLGKREKEADLSFSLSKYVDKHQWAEKVQRKFWLEEELPVSWAVDRLDRGRGR